MSSLQTETAITFYTNANSFNLCDVLAIRNLQVTSLLLVLITLLLSYLVLSRNNRDLF